MFEHTSAAVPAATAAVAPARERTDAAAAFEIVPHTEVERAAQKFHEFGFCLLGEALGDEQLMRLTTACGDVFEEVAAFDGEQKGSRGAARYGLGSMTAHAEWTALIDNPRVLPVIDEIWGHAQCELLRCGMNGSFPGSADQNLHYEFHHISRVTIINLPLIINSNDNDNI